MDIVTELAVSVVGGVMTALVLGAFSRPHRMEAVSARANERRERGGRSVIGDFFRMIFAVGGGIGVAMIGGRMLIQADVLPKGLPTRLGLLVAATAVIWILLGGLRRR